MDRSKPPLGLIVVVLAALAAMAYIAWLPRPGALIAPPAPLAMARPTPVLAPQATALPSAAPAAQVAARPTSTAAPVARIVAQPTLTPAPQIVAQPTAIALAPTAAVSADLFGPRPLTSISGPDDWAMEGNNPSRTRSIHGALVLPLSQRREVRVSDDTGTGSPLTIARGTMLVESQHHLRALDLSSGEQRWEVPLAGVYISPAVAGDFVFVRSEADNKGQMLALDVHSGKQIWAFTPKRLSSPDNSYFGGHLTSPVVVDGTVFVGAGQEVYALNANTGAVRWTFTTKDYISSSATLAGGRVYISDFRYFYALDQQSGAVLWSHPTTLSIYFSPVVADQAVLLTDGDNLTALEAASGKQLWSVQIPGQVLIPGAVSGSRVFVKTVSTLYALDLASGGELWHFADHNFISLPAVASDQVFVISGSGADTALLALDVVSGQSTWRQPVAALSTVAPVIAGKTIYVRTGDGRVLGFWH
jgi:outer membrane protein assembly factor BamB